MHSDLSEVRVRSREARAAIDPVVREQSSQAIAEHLARLESFEKAQSVGVYFSMAEEVDTSPIIRLCEERNKLIYLPVVEGKGSDIAMSFHPYDPSNTRLEKNRFGIEEPVVDPKALVSGESLELVCVPTVAFNSRCDRIGMGGGYYDRSFANHNTKGSQSMDAEDSQPISAEGSQSMDAEGSQSMGAEGSQTFLVGLAFDCQQADFLAQKHDVQLDAIVTESTIIYR